MMPFFLYLQKWQFCLEHASTLQLLKCTSSDFGGSWVSMAKHTFTDALYFTFSGSRPVSNCLCWFWCMSFLDHFYSSNSSCITCVSLLHFSSISERWIPCCTWTSTDCEDGLFQLVLAFRRHAAFRMDICVICGGGGGGRRRGVQVFGRESRASEHHGTLRGLLLQRWGALAQRREHQWVYLHFPWKPNPGAGGRLGAPY